MIASTPRVLADSISSRSRAWKASLLEALIPDGASVLALGVTDPAYSPTSNQVEIRLAGRTRLTGLYYPDLPDMRARCPFPLVRADALSLPFADNSFDFVFSNAVVEHVGDFEQQRNFVCESLRVARRGVVHTTPNRWFPVETHSYVPLLHWLPRRYHKRLLTNRSYHWRNRDRLLSLSEFRSLFPCRTVIDRWPAAWPMTLVVSADKSLNDTDDPPFGHAALPVDVA